jgi:hypothetical protein
MKPAYRRRFGETLSPIAYLSNLQIVHPTKGRVPWELYPYQKELLRDESRERLVIKAREVGISQTISGEAVYKAKYAPESRIVVISRNGQEAKEIIKYCGILASEDPDLGTLEGTQEVKVPSFSPETCAPATDPRGKSRFARIIAEAASPSAGRGGGKLAVYVDEFAHGNFKFWGRLIWQSVKPSVTLGGAITFVSTPQGKANMFYRLYMESLKGINKFNVHRINWDQSPVYNPKGFSEADPTRRRKLGEQSEWFQTERPSYSDGEWAEEYDCDFASSAGLVYPEFDELLSVGDYAYNPNWPTYVCQDFGFNNPAVALVLQVSPSEDVFVIKELYKTRRSISSLVNLEYAHLLEEYHPLAWYCDPSDPDNIKTFNEAGFPAVASPQLEVERGIKHVRRYLKVPGENRTRLHIDRGCPNFITDMGTWAYKPDTDKPEKDLNDHGCDAFRYFVQSQVLQALTNTTAYTWGALASDGLPATVRS